MKIKAEVEIPNSDSCDGCQFLEADKRGDDYYCVLFNIISDDSNPKKCLKCKELSNSKISENYLKQGESTPIGQPIEIMPYVVEFKLFGDTYKVTIPAKSCENAKDIVNSMPVLEILKLANVTVEDCGGAFHVHSHLVY